MLISLRHSSICDARLTNSVSICSSFVFVSRNCMTRKRKGVPSDGWESAIFFILDEHGEQADIVRAIGAYDPKLSQVTAMALMI